MARGEYTQPKRYGLPEDHESEAVQKRAAKEFRTKEGRKASREGHVAAKSCRVCGIILSSGTEWRIGVHIWCVYRSGQRTHISTVPRPRYGAERHGYIHK